MQAVCEPFVYRKPLNGNIVDPDEMPHSVAFHQGLHCLLIQNRSSEKRKHYFLEIIACDPSIYTKDNPKCII